MRAHNLNGVAGASPLITSRAALWALGIVQAIAFPLSIAGLYWFLLLGS